MPRAKKVVAPKNAAARKPNRRFDFGEAIRIMRDEKLPVRRRGWNGKGMWIAIQRPTRQSKMKQAYIYMSPVGGELIPWLASQSDMLADDWQVA